MKKILSMTLVCVMLLGMMFTLASCGKTLSGEYEFDGGILGTTTYAFSGKEVTVTYKAEILGATVSKEFVGEYEITTNENDEEVIVFTFTDEDASEYSGSHTFVEGKEGDVKYIKIDDVKLTKKEK